MKTLLCIISILILFVANLLIGSVDIPATSVIDILTGSGSDNAAWEYIVVQNRLPQALTALIGGSSLAMTGLMLQTAFRNPLAGPGIFGINTGASLGVAIVMMFTGGTIAAGSISFSGFFAILGGAFIGAMAVMLVIFFVSRIVRNNTMLLIVGIMIGYMASSAISLLNFFATAESIQSYTIWGMGTFAGVTLSQLPLFSVCCIIGLIASLLMIKPLNALMLGDAYASNLGVSPFRVRNRLLFITGWLTAIVTAWCGPIGFIGLAVPHIARIFFRTDNHLVLMPSTLALGAVVALLCNLISVVPGALGIIPLNAVTPIIGAPVIIYVIAKRRD